MASEWLEGFLEHVQWLRDHAQKRIDEECDTLIGKRRCIPLDSQLNAYLQGQRDVATELLARARKAQLEETAQREEAEAIGRKQRKLQR